MGGLKFTNAGGRFGVEVAVDVDVFPKIVIRTWWVLVPTPSDAKNFAVDVEVDEVAVVGHENFPVEVAYVAPSGRIVSRRTLSPSGSSARTVNSRSVPAVVVASSGPVNTGK